jgi:hypothetical protein
MLNNAGGKQTMTWEEAARIAEQIAASPDGGNWHAQVAATGQDQDYTVAVRQHNTHTYYQVSSLREFIALCDQLMRLGQ